MQQIVEMDSYKITSKIDNVYTHSLNGCYGVLMQTETTNISYHISPLNKDLISHLKDFCKDNVILKCLQFYSCDLKPIEIISKKVAYIPIDINAKNIMDMLNVKHVNFIGIENNKFIYKGLNLKVC